MTAGPTPTSGSAAQERCGCAAAQAAADRTRFEQLAAMAALLALAGTGSLVAYAAHAAHAAGTFVPHLP